MTKTLLGLGAFALLSLGQLRSQTLYLANTSNSGLGRDFVINDSFSLSITGAAPNAPVTLNFTQNGVGSNGNNMGNTDANGAFSLTGVEGSANIGTWTETWFVNGVQVGDEQDFIVMDRPTGLTVVNYPV